MSVVTKSFYDLVKAELKIDMPEHDWLVLCRSWQTAEGGTATHNPWNITLVTHNSTPYNEVPVQNYPTQADGVTATVAVLEQADHALILEAMRNNASPYFVAVQIGQSDWGTNLDLFIRVMADNYDFEATRVV